MIFSNGDYIIEIKKKKKKEKEQKHESTFLQTGPANIWILRQRAVERAGKPGLATSAGVQHEPNSFNSVQGNVHTRKHPLDINTLLISSSLCDPGYYTVP